MVDPFPAETFVRMYRVLIFGIRLPPIRVLVPRLSSFCKMSSDTSFSELISGTTSSCNATFLYSMLDATAATLVVVVAFVRVFTGIGISVPDAIMALLLLRKPSAEKSF
jgi:hypothetical protein